MRNAPWNNMRLFSVHHIISILLLITIVVFISCKKKDITPAPPKDVVSKRRIDPYTEVQYGNMPLIISVPHGGTEEPASIPDRICPGITTVTDSRTIELVNAIDSVCKADYNVQPYFIICYLKRTKIDQNRDLAEATCSNIALNVYWNNYHLGLDTCVTKILNKYSSALFIDLHGHGHTKQRLELGYLISDDELRNPAGIISSNTSVYHLLQQTQNTAVNINQLIAGTNAFGTLMAIKNFASVPSQQDPAPAIGDTYFDGGYNTRRYTVTSNPKVFGWQVECNFTGVRDNQTSRIAFAKAFLQSLMQYYTLYTTMPPFSFGR